MSHHTLQKLTVRMFYDEAFATAVYEDTDKALAGLDLTDLERAQLLTVDRRAWRHDVLRQRRTLRTLAEEFKIATTIVLAETRSLAALERFFASAFFHRAIQQRGSLALAFAEFLLDGCQQNHWKADQLPDVIRLEKTFAACRRSLERETDASATDLPSTISDRAQIRLAPGCDVAAFEANVIATVQHVEKYLFELSLMPAMALCDDAPRLMGLPPVARPEKVWLLFSPGATGITLTELDKASYQVLNETRQPIAIRNLIARPGVTKTGAQQAQAVLSEWLENGALILAG
jgi:hypothetical protein